MSTLRARIEEHLEKNEKPNFLWYTLLVQGASAHPDDKRAAMDEIREKMEETYKLTCVDDAWWLMYGVRCEEDVVSTEGGGSGGGGDSPKRKRDDHAEPSREEKPQELVGIVMPAVHSNESGDGDVGGKMDD